MPSEFTLTYIIAIYLTSKCTTIQKKWATALGLTILEDMKGYNEKTVLIAAPSCSSVKLMAALSTTKHIVTQQWLKACYDANHFVSTSKYLAANHAEAIENGERFRASRMHIFSGMFVHRVMGTNGIKYNKPSIEELKDLVELSGGEWVPTQRKAGNSHVPKLLLLMDDNDFEKPKQTEYIQALLDKGATKIRWSELKNCLLSQSLEPLLEGKVPKPKSRAQAFKFKETLHSLLTSPQRGKIQQKKTKPTLLKNTRRKCHWDWRRKKERLTPPIPKETQVMTPLKQPNHLCQT